MPWGETGMSQGKYSKQYLHLMQESMSRPWRSTRLLHDQHTITLLICNGGVIHNNDYDDDNTIKTHAGSDIMIRRQLVITVV